MNEGTNQQISSKYLLILFSILLFVFITGFFILFMHVLNSTNKRSITLSSKEFNKIINIEKPTAVLPVVPTNSGKLNKTNYIVSITPVGFKTHKSIYKEYSGAIQYASHLTGVSQRIITNVIYQESRGNPSAISNADAVGLMQLIPYYGGRVGYKMLKGYSITPTTGYLQNSWNNIILGTLYIKYLMQQFSKYPYKVRVGLSLASYNWGIARVQYILSFNKVNNWKEFTYVANKYFPFTTKQYVSNIEQPLDV